MLNICAETRDRTPASSVQACRLGRAGGVAATLVSLPRSVTVSIAAVWISSLVCFYFLQFRDAVLVRTLGPVGAYLLVGSAYPVVVGLSLSSLVSTKRRRSFVGVFSILFVAAILLMTAVLKLMPGVPGGYAAGLVAVSWLGGGICYYLNRQSKFILIGISLASWTFLGDFAGYSAQHVLGGLAGAMAYATTYSVFLGSGLGAIIWYVQKR